MSKIKLANLTPEVYYKESRDFQFIGRLYDTVLNSVKTNAEDIYYLPISENSDEKLVDLMTLTLGFKSRHNYNVKQLTSLCSAFATIIRNKGNIESIILAARSLLQAEGIDEDVAYTFGEFGKEITNRTILNLFIPEKLTDINLLRDLLIYILPAGMSCNLIREFRLKNKSTTELTTIDDIVVYEGTYANNSTVQTLITADTNAKSITPKTSQGNLTNAYAESTPGLLMNGDIYRPTYEDGSTPEQYPITYNIIYVTNGGKIINTASTKYVYTTNESGDIILPTAVTRRYYNFKNWKDENNDPITQILSTSRGDRTITAEWEHCTVWFDMQGHGAQIAGLTTAPGNLIPKPGNPSESGYTFGGWYRETSYITAWDFDNDKVPAVPEGTTQSNIILYAKWTKTQ